MGNPGCFMDKSRGDPADPEDPVGHDPLLIVTIHHRVGARLNTAPHLKNHFVPAVRSPPHLVPALISAMAYLAAS